MRLALLVGSLALMSSTAEAKCMQIPIVPKPLTAANAEVGPGGGVLLALTYGKQNDREDEAVEKKSWRFQQGGKLVEPAIKLLAPGLAVYELAGDRGGTLVDDKKKPVVAVRRGKGVVLAQPVVKSATGKIDDDGDRWGASFYLTLELPAVPAGVTGLIVYQGTKAVNWTILDPKSGKAQFNAGGHCSNDLPGSSVPTSGDITIAWFDSTGRVSPPSPTIAIKKG